MEDLGQSVQRLQAKLLEASVDVGDLEIERRYRQDAEARLVSITISRTRSVMYGTLWVMLGVGCKYDLK